MSDTEKEMMDHLSKTVTSLCEAIDPKYQHGPESEKIISYAIKTRELLKNLSVSTYTGNIHNQRNLAKEALKHLDYSPFERK